MQEYLTHSEAETEQAGADFARALPDGKVVAMYGELGSGKTAFVRGMARNRGSVCAVEWSENVEDAFYGDEIVVRFEKLGPTTRRITITEGSGTSC